MTIDIIRPEVRGITAYNAGLTPDEVARRYGVTDIVKLGSNENPLGASALAMAAYRAAQNSIHIYPDPAAIALRNRIAAKSAMPVDNVIIGNGSEDLLSVICRTVIRPGDKVVTPYPSFPLHEDYARLCGGQVARVPVDNDFGIDLDALIAAGQDARLLVLANPMNPVGSGLNAAGLTRLARELPDHCLLVVDEAYYEYARASDCADALQALRARSGHWMILRTFSKAYALAALRIGYAFVRDVELRTMMDRVRTPFNTNGPAQSAALEAMEDEAHLSRSVALVTQERARVSARLQAIGFKVAPSGGNFLFFDSGRPSVEVADELLRQGVIVKPWKQAGFDSCLRVSIGSYEENCRFLAAIAPAVDETD